MRCVDVIRELSIARGDTQVPGIAKHLAECPGCAEWAARDARVGQLWDATRGEDPGVEVWEPVWGRICQALDETRTDVLPLKRRSSSRRIWYVALGVAQAAAVLMAVLYFRHAGTTEVPRMVQNVPVAPAHEPPSAAPGGSVNVPVATRDASDESESSVSIVEIPAGELVVIRKDGDHFKADELAMNSGQIQVDPAFEGLNSLEAIAQ